MSHHTHIRNDGGHSYRHDHSEFVPADELRHLQAQHQPRLIPTVRVRAGKMVYIDLDAKR